MASLAWLLIPLFAAIGAAIWGSWAARDRTQGDISELAGYARFREAMDRADRSEAWGKAHSGSDAV
ncbi:MULTISPECIES: hypothetical protein [unclassified Streptomyces]|uniref:hypothetical protein n=1 Tax=unclassified Streptomyces TaxID=2593676 RepID=UPI0022517A68|nr:MULTISPECIES: hypothetical protein [unclassified Streptomyces]MCX4527960.1 hypothetical protein [Streptomyces sp. NBC_01551]MCX4541425.1 hypothetical protein [Streptomyces sp. NBC_01565]